MDIISVEAASQLWNYLIGQAYFKILQNLLWAATILLLTRLAVGWVGGLTRKALGRTEPTLRKFLIQVSEIFTLVVGMVAVLNRLGIETTSVVAVVGAAGLAIGLALQNTLSHFAAGVMLISLRPFEVGDYIEGAGAAGVVDAIGIFSTTLVTRDNVVITVPNGQLFSGTLKNTTVLGKRRVDLEIDIGDRPIEPTITLLLSLIQPHPLVLEDPKTTCHVASISATGTILYLRPWCAAEAYDHVRSEVQQLVKEALREPELSL
jgi:small conductance mechanosensitive channel